MLHTALISAGRRNASAALPAGVPGSRRPRPRSAWRSCLLWRATRSTAALALVGLHPEVAGSIVNAGHNDAMVALGLLWPGVAPGRDGHLRRGLGARRVAAREVDDRLRDHSDHGVDRVALARRGGRYRAFVIPDGRRARRSCCFIPGADRLDRERQRQVVITRLSDLERPAARVVARHPRPARRANYVTVGIAGRRRDHRARRRASSARRPDPGRGAAVGCRRRGVAAAGYVLAVVPGARPRRRRAPADRATCPAGSHSRAVSSPRRTWYPAATCRPTRSLGASCRSLRSPLALTAGIRVGRSATSNQSHFHGVIVSNGPAKVT